MGPGKLIRQRRLAHRLTQTQLAIRAGSTQAAVSRLERDELSPTIETLQRLLETMGETAEIVVRRSPGTHDRARLASLRARPPGERLALALSWNLLAGEIGRGGERARSRSNVTRRDIPLDAREILRVLKAHAVDYVVIGGVAVQAHGHPRTTQDLDIVPEPGAENLQRLQSALAALAARPVGKRQPEPLQIPPNGVFELDTDAGGLDLHLDPPGAAAYAHLRTRALRIELEGTVLVASLDDLIAMKRAAGRPIDRSDILALTEPSP